ncbi:hypothetical protein CYMTET_11039 [Cymbomonas tetramitiformis]|uniref:Uncharacterized protein n=1 Tax=Cymbomonas tetramitiformis TaxID=36881 RepID=A0AAE0GMX8_9CHLO|nr:hypothetical protein CYMTET_11039 [Cymbomonas tetramitiformis]
MWDVGLVVEGWLDWRSFYDKIADNRKRGQHTLCLLDIRVKEPTVRALCTGKKEYEPPRYMSVNTCCEQLLEVEAERKGGGRDSLLGKVETYSSGWKGFAP